MSDRAFEGVEGDLNASPRRAEWTRRNIGPQTRQWLEEDAFTIVGDDPLSARVDCRRVVLLRRGDWSARQEVSSSMTASLEDFFVTTSAQALEGSKAVFANAWAFQVPRDHT